MNSIKVLIIHEESEFASILTRHLNSWGFIAMSAAGVEEAREMMARIGPEVVLLGIEADEREGWQTFDWIQAAYPETKILLLTGKGTALTALSGMQRGAFDVLSHPVELGVLCEAIRRAHRHDFCR